MAVKSIIVGQGRLSSCPLSIFNLEIGGYCWYESGYTMGIHQTWREFSIKFNNDLKSRSAQLEKNLEERLQVLEREMFSSEEVAQEFHECKRELLEIQLLASKEAMVRARAKWLALGEHPTKYFLNLEKRNYDDRSITSLVNEQGNLVTEQKDILALEKKYYASQHSDQSSIPDDDPYCPPPLSILV